MGSGRVSVALGRCRIPIRRAARGVERLPAFFVKTCVDFVTLSGKLLSRRAVPFLRGLKLRALLKKGPIAKMWRIAAVSSAAILVAVCFVVRRAFFRKHFQNLIRLGYHVT